jgi:hypothetical protein
MRARERMKEIRRMILNDYDVKNLQGEIGKVFPGTGNCKTLENDFMGSFYKF